MIRTQAHTFKLHGMASTRRMRKPFTPPKAAISCLACSRLSGSGVLTNCFVLRTSPRTYPELVSPHEDETAVHGCSWRDGGVEEVIWLCACVTWSAHTALFGVVCFLPDISTKISLIARMVRYNLTTREWNNMVKMLPPVWLSIYLQSKRRMHKYEPPVSILDCVTWLEDFREAFWDTCVLLLQACSFDIDRKTDEKITLLFKTRQQTCSHDISTGQYQSLSSLRGKGAN